MKRSLKSKAVCMAALVLLLPAGVLAAETEQPASSSPPTEEKQPVKRVLHHTTQVKLPGDPERQEKPAVMPGNPDPEIMAFKVVEAMQTILKPVLRKN